MNSNLDRIEFYAIHQKFVRPQITDIDAAAASALSNCLLSVSSVSGKRIAVTAGSRGIAKIDQITKAIVGNLKSLEANPIVIPAMGSHGGATADGQREILKSLGITAQSVGCDIVSSMDTVIVGTNRQGVPIHVSRDALQADGLIIINRIKQHTRFDGAIESGIIKMLLIGLGKHIGAETYHRVLNHGDFQATVHEIAPLVMNHAKVIGGIAIVENAFEEVAELHGVPAVNIMSTEPQLQRRAKALLPRLPFDSADLLVVDEMGKDISGTGMDTNVVGRKFNDRAAREDEIPNIHTIYLRALTKKTGGNASGMGIAEMCHQRFIDGVDRQKTNVNCITAGHLPAAMTPVIFSTDREAIETAAMFTPWQPEGDTRCDIAWIENTKRLEWMLCSKSLSSKLVQHSELIEPVTISHKSSPLQFDGDGDLLPLSNQIQRLV